MHGISSSGSSTFSSFSSASSSSSSSSLSDSSVSAAMAELRQVNWERFNKSLAYTLLSEVQKTALEGPTVRYYAEKGAFSAEQFLTVSEASLRHLQSKDIRQVIEQGTLTLEAFLKLSDDNQAFVSTNANHILMKKMTTNELMGLIGFRHRVMDF